MASLLYQLSLENEMPGRAQGCGDSGAAHSEFERTLGPQSAAELATGSRLKLLPSYGL